MKEAGPISFMPERSAWTERGQLFERFQELKRRLEEMGMFAPEYKQPIPRYVKKVGRGDGLLPVRPSGIS